MIVGGIEVLDLRDFRERPAGAKEFLALWGGLEQALFGRTLEPGRDYTIDGGARGSVRITVISAGSGAAPVQPETPFSVRTALERPQIRYHCALCRAEGRDTYGPFLCRDCGTKEQVGRVCDEHVAILDDSMRSTCRSHVPACICGQPATFWCQGPGCRRNKAHCDRHRRNHPSDPENWYCPDCYDYEFPACSHLGCINTGTVLCEFISEGSDRICGRRACPRHAGRWQVYGAHAEGLGLCEQHIDLGRWDEHNLIRLIIAGTAARRLQTRSQVRLARLNHERHIILNVKKRNTPIHVLAPLFDDLERRFSGDTALAREMASVLRQHASVRGRELENETTSRGRGQEHFDRLRTKLVVMGLVEIANQLRFCDFRPGANLLFVDLPEQYRGKLIGRQGSTIKQLQTLIGVDIKFE
jgi:predicted RNA-binding protein YlqC (UPF0109 family)